MTITDSDIGPAQECPVCGETIATWYSVRNVEERNENCCYLQTERVEFQGPGGGPDTEYICIDHTGPQL